MAEALNAERKRRISTFVVAGFQLYPLKVGRW
jgi:hypothetical protein